MALMKLSDRMSLQMKTVGKEQQFTEKNNGFLQNTDVAEGAMQNLQREFTKMDRILDRSDDENNIFSEKPQSDFHHNMPELGAEHHQDLQNEQDEQETNQVQHEDPQVPTSLQFSEESIPELQENTLFQLNHWNIQMGLQVRELGADHIDWMEKMKNIMQKINLTENTVKSLLNEVVSLEGHIEKLESQKDFDPDKGANIEVKLIAIFFQNFYKDMTLLNTKLGMYQRQEGKTDSQSPEEMGVEEREPLHPQAPSPPLGENTPSGITMWKRALRIFIMFYVLTFTGLSCYILFFDATFIFESLLPTMLGHRRMWELREIIRPFLNLQVEDLLPS
uniref:Single-pass membrane protein with coiled-coil domains 2 n=1 Tax=Panthera leo TaxID=9689 RepID=A0A8C8XMH2_PANLE